MKKVLVVIILLSLGNLVFAASDSAELQSLLGSLSSLQGNFLQTVKSEQGKVLQRISGKVWLKKPAQFRWEVLGNEPRLVIADGKKVWDYDRDLEQVTVQKLNASQTKAPIFFLTGEAQTIDKDFKVSMIPLKNGSCMDHCNACFELKPKRGEGSFQWIRIGFKDKILNHMQLLDQLGQYSDFVFKNVKLNGNITNSQFHFTPPKGVDVLVND